jgi:hypothetical protein
MRGPPELLRFSQIVSPVGTLDSSGTNNRGSGLFCAAVARTLEVNVEQGCPQALVLVEQTERRLRGKTSNSQKLSDISTGRSDRNVRSGTGLVIYGGLRLSRLTNSVHHGSLSRFRIQWLHTTESKMVRAGGDFTFTSCADDVARAVLVSAEV